MPQPHHVFRLFERVWPRASHALSYIGHDEDFPIGFIGGGPISAEQARQVVVDTFEHRHGPIINLALAPHPSHDAVHMLDHVPTAHTTLVSDALIIRKIGRFAIDTFVGDCSVIIVASDEWLGFLHCGTPELFDGLLSEFWSQWPNPPADTHVFIGPSITGKWYAYAPEKVPPKYENFIIAPSEDDNAFDTEYTFDVNLAIEREIQNWHPASIGVSSIDTFDANNRGDHRWASARFARYAQCRGIDYGLDGLSPRDCAFFAYAWPI